MTVRTRRTLIVLALIGLVPVGCSVFDVPGFLESRLVYFPERATAPAPTGAEDVWIETSDGLRLHGWLLKPETPPPWPGVLHVHGNAGSVADHVSQVADLPRHGYAVLVFDYRSFGRSDLAPARLDRHALAGDTLAALDFLATRDDVDRIALYGFSLGGVLGLAVASQRSEVEVAVIGAAFSSWKANASAHLGFPGRLLARSGLDATDSAASLSDRRLLLIHGERDEVVPVAHGEQIHAAAVAAGVDVTLVRVPHEDHNGVMYNSETQEAVLAFLDAWSRGPDGE